MGAAAFPVPHGNTGFQLKIGLRYGCFYSPALPKNPIQAIPHYRNRAAAGVGVISTRRDVRFRSTFRACTYYQFFTL